MDSNEPSMLSSQCVLCGDEFISVNVVDIPTTPVVDVVNSSRLFSIFLRCVSSSISDDEMDSNIVSSSESDLVNNWDSNNVFCSACTTALIQWDKLDENLAVITQNLNRLKLSIYVKILNNSKSDKSADHRVSCSQSLLLLLQKIRRVKDQICRQFSPRLTLKRISSSDQLSESSQNFGFDEILIKKENIQDGSDDDDNYSENNNSKWESFNSKFRANKAPLKLIGPGKFLYKDKYVFSQRNNDRYECAECSSVITQRCVMLRHIRQVHMKIRRNGAQSRREPRRRPAVQAEPELPLDNDGKNVGHGDADVDWEMASECSSGDADDNSKANKRGQPRKRNRKDAKAAPYELVSTGPHEWLYAGKYQMTFDSEQGRYRCGQCPALRSERAGLLKHIRSQHMGGKQMALRPTGNPNEYIYKDKFKVTREDDNSEWCCGECGAQWKDKFAVMSHIRSAHMISRKKNQLWQRRRYEEVAPNDFRCYGNYSFRFDPSQQLYHCSLCDYTSSFTAGVLGHIRGNHCTDSERQEHRAVEVGPGVYMYGGKYKIVLEEDGRFRCALCGRIREFIHELYPHFRVDHGDDESEEVSAVAGDESSQNSIGARREKAEQKAQMASIESRRLKRAIAKGWKTQGNDNTWVYKDEWQVAVDEESGKYKCSTCGMVAEGGGDRHTMFLHVQSVHANETVINPPVRVRLGDESAELEHMGVAYKYDPIQDKYACSLCPVKLTSRSSLRQHIKLKHIHPEKFMCDICGHETESRLAFRRHRARHEGPKYVCTVCDKGFTADRYLREHLKIHMGEDAKRHQCEFCGKKFYTLKQLKNHRPSHTGETPFPCDLCGEGFATTFKRREHRKKFHGGLPQKHGWKPAEEEESQDVVVDPLWVCSTAGDLLNATEAE